MIRTAAFGHVALVLEGGYNLRTTSVSLGECLKVSYGPY
eukprot:SAG22_NODE_1927_length_3297_cov_3.294872_3_plen_39_part_00